MRAGNASREDLATSPPAAVLTGENVSSAEFIVVGDQPKRVIIRALGVPWCRRRKRRLADHALDLYQGDTLLARTQLRGFEETESRNRRRNGKTSKPHCPHPGASSYTAVLRGKVMARRRSVEAYDLNQAPNSKLGNISTRGLSARRGCPSADSSRPNTKVASGR